MFFTNPKEARLYARLERIKTGYNHTVTPCNKYLCPPKTYFGMSQVPGFTVILK